MESQKRTNIQIAAIKSTPTRRRHPSKTTIALSNLAADEYWEEFHVELARVSHWLKKRLKTKEVPYATILKEARKNGMSRATVRRAFLLLGGLSRKENTKNGPWYWGLPVSSSAKK